MNLSNMFKVKSWILILEKSGKRETFVESLNEISLTMGWIMMEVQILDNKNPRHKSHYTLAPVSLLENAWIVWIVFNDYSHVNDRRSIYWMLYEILDSSAQRQRNQVYFLITSLWSICFFHLWMLHAHLHFAHRFAFEYECCAVSLHSIHL